MNYFQDSEGTLVDLQLALDNQSTRTNYGALSLGGVLNDDNVVAGGTGHVVVLLLKIGPADVADSSENT